ncbi:FHA domain-containing protein [Solimonas sp. K1W22B-7]|uniref:FHA domain-containing protein n=1 Tax=Solimonas sp. K1W22B-7 TaxID=2303331 RepID=UPI000E331C91|nr:FHA domain-containing protein [Solimonas sp. K1W22B-7]AXQ29663.1 FHA domain-containing protein [Solimonas sp. K1W22B-7]
MGKLIVTDSSGQTKDFPLNKERVTIGRHADNDIPLNDKAVSGHHAVVITILQDSFLEDLDSTNGTQVNSKQIAKHPLSHGDVISIGRNSLRYEGEGQGGDDDFEKTMILKPGQFGAAFDAQVSKAATAAPTPPPSMGASHHPVSAPPAAPNLSQTNAPKPIMGKLRVVSGPNQGKELELSKALTTIGKPGVQVAAITRRADGYYIVHVGGQAGGAKPLVNGNPLDTQARKLADGDIVELAGTQMSFMIMS